MTYKSTKGLSCILPAIYESVHLPVLIEPKRQMQRRVKPIRGHACMECRPCISLCIEHVNLGTIWAGSNFADDNVGWQWLWRLSPVENWNGNLFPLC